MQKLKALIIKHYPPVVLFLAMCVGVTILLYVYALIESITAIHPIYE